MVLEKNELLLDLRTVEFPKAYEILKKLTPEDLNETPVVLRRGAIDIKIGVIHKTRIGKDTIYGEALLRLEGHLEFEQVLDEAGKNVIGVEIKKYVYQVA